MGGRRVKLDPGLPVLKATDVVNKFIGIGNGSDGGRSGTGLLWCQWETGFMHRKLYCTNETIPYHRHVSLHTSVQYSSLTLIETLHNGSRLIGHPRSRKGEMAFSRNSHL